MDNLIVPEPPPDMDSFAPEFCFCGRETVESHEYWYCSTKCARADASRSLDNPECHYRRAVRDAYIRAGVPELYPRRMMSVDQLRPAPYEQCAFANVPPRSPPPKNATHHRNIPTAHPGAQDGNLAGFPTLSQVTGKVLTRKATAGELLLPERHDRPRWEGLPNASSRAHRVQTPEDHSFQQISLDAVPLQDPAPPRSLRHVPPSSHSLRSGIRKSVTALLNVGRSRKEKEDESTDRIFGHPVNTIVPPVRKESLPSNRLKGPPSTIPSSPSSRALRRSASFAGWGPSDEQDPVMRVIKEMREEMAESFDPRSLFDQEEPY